MKQAVTNRSGNGNGHGLRTTLPRALKSPTLKKRQRLVVIFQGGSPADRMRVAHMLGDHLELKVYRVDLRPCISRFIGETEKNLDRIFELVEPESTLLYLDEADWLFGKEPSLPSGFDRSARWWIPYLNKRLKEFHGAVLFATNSHSKNSKISRQLKPVVARIA